jgi:hypothetical protein
MSCSLRRGTSAQKSHIRPLCALPLVSPNPMTSDRVPGQELCLLPPDMPVSSPGHLLHPLHVFPHSHNSLFLAARPPLYPRVPNRRTLSLPFGFHRTCDAQATIRNSSAPGFRSLDSESVDEDTMLRILSPCKSFPGRLYGVNVYASCVVTWAIPLRWS